MNRIENNPTDVLVSRPTSLTTRPRSNGTPSTNRARLIVRPLATKAIPPAKMRQMMEPRAPNRSKRRQIVFRCARLILAAILVTGAFLYGRHLLLFVASDQAYINGEMVLLRAPIEGRLELHKIQPGQALSAGQAVFRIENPRYGNREAMSRLAWASEYADRLALETAEAEVRFAQQDQIFTHHRRLHDQNLISDLEFLEEQTRWATVRAALTNRQTQWSHAEARRREAMDQLGLQRSATTTMPFDGVAWSVLIQDGQQVAEHEPVLQVINPDHLWVDAFLKERHARQLVVGGPVNIRSQNGQHTWRGRVESIRGATGAFPLEGEAALAAGWRQRPQVAVRVQMESPPPYGPAEFYGVGRSVVVTLANDE